MHNAAVDQVDEEFAYRFAAARNNGDISVYFQPRVTLPHGALVGAEALLRWHDTARGWISPSQFMPYIARNGLLSTLGSWVMAEVGRHINEWKALGLNPTPVISVNVSVQQLETDGFFDEVLSIARLSGLTPGDFEFEITEETMMRWPERVIETIGLLVRTGFKLSIDDFGTGYSSLSYLHRLPVHTLKIDRCFVEMIVEDKNSQSIVEGIVSIARNLGLTVLAEGVETAQQAEQLARLGCQEGQGFYFSPPLCPEEFAARWLAL